MKWLTNMSSYQQTKENTQNRKSKANPREKIKIAAGYLLQTK
jgi:hypothetical protein